MVNTYVDIVKELALLVNYSRVFGPIFTWILISYIYFGIGVHSGNSLWKQLYLVCSYGFIANIFYIIRQLSKNLNNYEYLNSIIYLKYIENIFFGWNEWGLVYINFVKIRSCIKSLRSKFWTVFINILYFYIICFHLLTTYYEIKEAQTDNKETETISMFLYIPISILEIYFIVLIILATINEDNDKSKDTLTILLNSSLSRMFFVSLILLGIAIIACIEKYNSGNNNSETILIKRILVRLKGAIGIIYLIDLLMIRIDLNKNTIKKHQMQLLKYSIKEKNHELNNDEDENDDVIELDPEDPYGLNKTPILDYGQPSSSISKSHNKYSPTFNYNNGNRFLNTPTSDVNNDNIFKISPISEYRDSASFLPVPTNTPMISNIVTPYTNDMYFPSSSSNKKNRNNYKKLSNSYNIIK